MSTSPSNRRAVDGAAPASDGGEVRPAAILEALGRHKGQILAVGLLVGLIVGLAGLMAPRTYTSATQLLIDPRGLRVLEKDISPQAREADQSVSVIESEMRFLSSDLVLNRVIEKLGLLRAPGLGLETGGAKSGEGGDPIGWLRAKAKAMLGRSDTSRMTPEQAALVAMQKAVHVARAPNTYVIDIAVTLKDRQLAARVADGIASEYIAARFTSRGEASRRASASIDGRLEELARQVRETDAAVERYKASNDLVSASGRLLTESRMGELSTQLQVARAETVRAEARMAQVRALREAGGTGDASIEALQSPTLERLRSNIAQVRQREAALSAQLLPAHPLIRQVRQESQAAQRSIEQELGRIADTAGQALARAQATERALEAQLNEMKARSLGESRAQVELRELERVAEATRSVYQTFLVRSRELAEQQRIDPNSAVVLAQAEPARAPNGPGLIPLVGAASMAGLGLGAMLALRRDRRDPVVRSAYQIETLVGDCPVHTLALPRPRRGGLAGGGGNSAALAAYIAAPPGSAGLEAAERLHRAIVANARRRSPLICLVTAGEPLAQKSALALNLALAAARTGESVLIIDADRDERTATLAAEAQAKAGLAEVVDGKAACGTTLLRRPDLPVDLLPAGKLGDLRPTRARLDRLADTLFAPLAGYDLVVIDGGVAGRDRLTQALAARADAAVLAVAEGASQKAQVAEAGNWLSAVAGGLVHVALVTKG